MLKDLTKMTTSNLVEMLTRDTDYYMDLCQSEENVSQRKIVKQKIDALIMEIRNRGSENEIPEQDMSSKPAE